MNTLRQQSSPKHSEHPDVLLVEDSLADAIYVQEILASSIYGLEHVATLAAARDYISNHQVKIILLDLSLPDAHGLEALLSLQSLMPQIPVLVLTGLDDESISTEAVRLGAQDYILKAHISEHTLSRSIRYAIERKRSEEIIRQSAIHARETAADQTFALAASQTGVWSYNPRTGKVTIDDQIEAIFGATGGSFGDRLEDFESRLHINDRAKTIAALQMADQAKAGYEAECRIVWPDGSVHHILLKGKAHFDETDKPLKISGVCVDITNRKEAEERLRLSLQASRTGTWILEVQNGKLIWDDQTHALFGVVPGEFSLKFADFLKLIDPADVRKVLRSSNAALGSGLEYHDEVKATWPDGSVHCIELRGQAYHDYPLRIAGACVDITERKVAEQEQQQLAGIVDSSDDGIIRLTTDGTVVSWNRAAERIYGYSAKEIIHRCIAVLMPDDAPEDFLLIKERLRREELIVQHETTRKRKDGVTIDVSLTISSIKDAAGTIIGSSAIVRDITEQKRTAKRLSSQYAVTEILSQSDSLGEASSKILPVLAETLGWDIAAFWYADKEQHAFTHVDTWHKEDLGLHASEIQKKHTTFSIDESSDVYGWSRGEPMWINDTSSSHSFPTAVFAYELGMHTVVAFPVVRKNRILGVILFYSRDVRQIDLEVNNMCASVCAQIGQFMDRKAAQQTARLATLAERSVARAILENAPIGIARLSESLTITEANNVFAQQFGLTTDPRAKGVELLLPAGIPLNELLSVVQRGVPFNQNNLRLIVDGQPAGRETFFDLTMWPVKDEQARTTGVIVLTADVTERVKLGQQREDFVATLTHDLKNPLIALVRMLDLFIAGEFGPIATDQARMLGLLKDSSADMLALIGTLLEVYRYEGGAPQLHLEDLDTRALVTNCIAQLRTVAEKKEIVLHNSIEAPHMVCADRMALKRVIMNLLDNAIKFAHSGTEIRFTSESTDKTITVSLTDYGSGISQTDLQALFRRFSQAKQGRKYGTGTGLGLYLCRQIVEAHGGQIHCTSTKNLETTFIISLPRSRAMRQLAEFTSSNQHIEETKPACPGKTLPDRNNS